MAGFILPLIMHILFGVEDMPLELGGASVIIPKNFLGAGYICAMFIVSCHVMSMFTGRCAAPMPFSRLLSEYVWQMHFRTIMSSQSQTERKKGTSESNRQRSGKIG